jgi:hypothetical protein
VVRLDTPHISGPASTPGAFSSVDDSPVAAWRWAVAGLPHTEGPGSWVPVGGVRSFGNHDSSEWREAHGNRIKVVRALLAAGYVARDSEATIPAGSGDYLWTDRPDRFEGWRAVGASGPRWRWARYAGARAVDPWATARRVADCSSAWTVSLRDKGASFGATAAPMPCGAHHVCPVCAGRRSHQAASAIREAMAAAPGASYVLITLTQRCDPGEALCDALDRWRLAWRRMTSGRSGSLWRSVVNAYHLGIEVGPKAAEDGRWHVHGHVVVELSTGWTSDAARAVIGERWESLTAWAAAPRELGWAPDETGARVAGQWADPVEGAGQDGSSWWRVLPDDRAVHEACKYPTPAADLPPAMLCEFLQAAHRRRWRETGGLWRGLHLREEPDPEVGVNMVRQGPGDRVVLDDVAPGLGLTGLDPGRSLPAPLETVLFVLTKGARVDAFLAWASAGALSARAIERGDGAVTVAVPRAWVELSLREWHGKARISRGATSSASSGAAETAGRVDRQSRPTSAAALPGDGAAAMPVLRSNVCSLSGMAGSL